MSNTDRPYTEVEQKNGVVRRVPKEYHKPLGKTTTVSMTLPITIIEQVNQLADEESTSKSRIYAQLLKESLEGRVES